MPVGSRTTNHHIEGLDRDSYTAHRLKHASPEHLHLTTRRFFIGPIPDGWLRDNRKSWYKRRVELSTYSSRKASFNAAADQGARHRTMTDFGGPSTTARINFSFPQPEDVDEEPSGSEASQGETEETDTEDEDKQTTVVEPVATHDAQQMLGNSESGAASPKAIPAPRDRPSEPGVGSSKDTRRQDLASPPPDSFHTAHQQIHHEESEEQPAGLSLTVTDSQRYDSDDQRLSTSVRNSSHNGGMTPEVDNNSKTRLLPQDTRPQGKLLSSALRPVSPKTDKKSMQQHAPAPIDDDDADVHLGRTNTGVRFKVSEGVANRQHRIQRRVGSTRDKVLNKKFRRNTMQEGMIVKMERMLVRMDFSGQQVPDEYDENESLKIDTRVIEKWREFMVVVRKSKKQDADDFRLQIYKTRVIPEIDNESTKKKPAREIRLDPKTTHVNLYSSLDKTVVLWHPYRKGTRIIIMRPTSTAHSVEWYTFLRDAMGWKRPRALQVSVPDLGVSVRLDKPFDGIREAASAAQDEDTAVAKTQEAEQAVAGRIIGQSIEILEKDPEWTDVLQMWRETAKMGLAWKRYDRLEWVHGATEQKMYGSMAMQKTYELELRPKEHYHTTARGNKGVIHEEPPPVEGFLIRLTSQKGVSKRMGKTFHKRLYYYTQNQFLMFNQPAKSTPPHPPRLATIGGSEIPPSTEIIEKTPELFDVEPFKVDNGTIAWLSDSAESVKRHDREAVEEARRNLANVESAEGYIDMCRIRKVRKMKWGSYPGDENRDAGHDSDVDFHDNVSDTSDEDGATDRIDDDRVLELVHDNDLVIRLQAYSKQARNEWVKRLRKLAKYWKLRIAGDTEIYKAVRRTNLSTLNIDEEMEALLGQFGRKWEVNRSEASSELYHVCGIASCRAISMSGVLFRKPRRRAAFQRCSVLLSAGKLLIHQATVRKRTGEQVRHLHQERQEVVDLQDCYVYSGLLVEEDLLYQNQTFDANNVAAGGARTPRVYLEGTSGEAWTSQDVDFMTCFVLWRNHRRGWFRTQQSDAGERQEDEKRSRIKRVAQLGVPGRGMVFQCRSRAERDHWVLSIAAEIERIVEMTANDLGDGGDARVTN
ncbi:uncharacterized protein HMPREF1541_02860 [Cyphellophora europaea CBS 101466]|uniref:PH domain-containing protein n=1 Tax=Cyphellophora europaea (strain CBS 101466) TaxID=1220924 RepID=W2S4S5_CYPE1|nr:uncharacterized protein HMPREF1541_02860 [Cyphellophora europaea CBS 101466]ETN43701.1 hypothetical protein HMPREF1541_02860 [Cyphellophora europaea CBS 101466]